MERSIIVKAETVEEAVRIGISILDVQMADVDIEIVTYPGRSMFGLLKNDAEVRVTTRDLESASSSFGGFDIEEIVDEMTQEGSNADGKLKEKQPGARIKNKKIELSFEGAGYPILDPKPNIRLFVNQEKIMERAIIKPDDKVKVKVSDRIIPPFYSIKLIDQDMFAMITLVPGKKITRTLLDTDFERVLRIEADEEIDYYNDLNPQAIVDELRDMGVQKGMIFSVIQSVAKSEVEMEDVIAKGLQPVEGTDGDIVMHVGLEESSIDEFTAIDYRESSKLLTINEGGLIATRIPAIPGKDGYNLLGEVIPAKRVQEVTIVLGKNVSIIGNDIIATIAGKPSVERRNKHIKIDVFKEFVHNRDVDLKSGNIRFDGDVRITGSVKPSMYVSASGNIHVGGSVSKATIHSATSITVVKNVFTSTISVGKQKHVLGELASSLEVILTYLEQLRDAVRQVLVVRGIENDELTAAELNHLIRLLLEKRYTTFQDLNKGFIQKVKNFTMELPEEWVRLANKYYKIFIHTSSQELQDAVGLDLLIEDSWALVELYREEPEPKSFLSIPYAINSELYCNGDIVVTSKGLYHSYVTAGNHISVKGVCRGGEVFAERSVILHESGSKTAVKTVVRTGASGSIRIGYVFAGTEVYVGLKKHVFKGDRSNVYVKLDENADLYIG